MFIAKPYERYRGMSRPMQQSWLRRRLNRVHVALDLHPYYINKVDREIERSRLNRGVDQ